MSFWRDDQERRERLEDARWHLTREHLYAIERRLDRILNLLTQEQTAMTSISEQVAGMLQDVQQTQGEVESVAKLLDNLTVIINSLKSQMLDPQTQSQLQQLQEAITANKAALADAIMTHTPADAPPPVVEPAPPVEAPPVEDTPVEEVEERAPQSFGGTFNVDRVSRAP